MNLLSATAPTFSSARSTVPKCSWVNPPLYLRITEQESTFLLFDILLQAITSPFLIIYSLLQVVGDFKEIRAAVDLQGKSGETLLNIPSFYTFNHRGKALSPSYLDPSATGKACLDSDD